MLQTQEEEEEEECAGCKTGCLVIKRTLSGDGSAKIALLIRCSLCLMLGSSERKFFLMRLCQK